MTTNLFFLFILFIGNIDLTFTLFRNFISDCICSIFIIYDLSLNMNLINDGLFFSSLSIKNFLSFFFWQLIKCLLLLNIQNFIFWNSDIQSFYSYFKLITTSCSVSTFSVSGLNDKHSFTINNVIVK